MDPVLKPWIALWDYLDGNFWHIWQWARDRPPLEARGPSFFLHDQNR